MEKKTDEILNKVIVKMDVKKFLKAIGLDKIKGKVKKVYANTWHEFNDVVEIEVEVMTEDRLKQIDYTKTKEV